LEHSSKAHQLAQEAFRKSESAAGKKEQT
jgi:hypothetical protein